MFKLLLSPPLPPVHSQTSFGNRAKGIRRQVIFAIFLPTCVVAPGKSFSMSCTCLPSSFPCIAPPFILSSSVKKKKTFLAVFFSQGGLAERAQQQTSDLLLPSISYPETLVSLFPISRKMYSCSHPSYPRFKTLLWNFKGSIRLFKDSDACFIFGSRVYGEQE